MHGRVGSALAWRCTISRHRCDYLEIFWNHYSRHHLCFVLSTNSTQATMSHPPRPPITNYMAAGAQPTELHTNRDRSFKTY
eukprot:scaffold30456_cov66-Cyclotella_meneghiniana.AAC.1